MKAETCPLLFLSGVLSSHPNFSPQFRQPPSSPFRHPTDVVGEFFSPFCLNYNPHSKIDEYLSGSNMPCLTFREPFIFYYCFIVSRTVVAIIIIIIIIVIVVIIYADVILFDLRD